MKRTIKVFIYPDEGGYVAECPDLNAVTQGETLDETLANVKEVVGLALEGEDPATFGLAPDAPLVLTVELGPLKHAG